MLGTGEGTFRFEMDDVDGETVERTYVFDHVPAGPHASGSVTVVEGELPILHYDLEGDGIVEARLAPGEDYDDVVVRDSAYYLRALGQVVSAANMPEWLKSWLLFRLGLVEKQIENDNPQAASAILATVERTIERNTPLFITVDEHALLMELVAHLAALL